MAGIDKGEGSREVVLRWGGVFLTLANFLTFAPLHLRKQSAGPQPCLVLTLEVNPSHFLMQAPLCVYCVFTIVFDCECVFLCVLCIILSPFHTENDTRVFRKN